MVIGLHTDLALALAEHVREERHELAGRWLQRLEQGEHVTVDDPGDELREPAAALVAGIADCLADAGGTIAADDPLVTLAQELGNARFAQGADAADVLKEYERLGDVLSTACADVASSRATQDAPADVAACMHRTLRVISSLGQVATAQYLRVLAERVGEREERLRRFNRMLSHELKNRVGATLGAGQLLQEEWLANEDRRRFAEMVADNAQAIQRVLENLVAMSKLDGERRRERDLMLGDVVTEVIRQLRELAKARQVHLRVVGELPAVEVNAAAVELCLSNYLSNAIKYSHPARSERWAEVQAGIEAAAGADDGARGQRLVVRVRDNGLGVPADQRTGLFERFFRAHEAVADVEGTGLGLSLVRETVESLGGEAWAEFEGAPGAVFVFSLPCRRRTDAGVSDAPAAASPGASNRP